MSETSKNGLRTKILEAQDRPREPVDVAEWGCTVWVRTLSAAERDGFEQASIEQAPSTSRRDRAVNLRNLRARLVVLCLVDEAGERIFSEPDAEVLGGKSAKVLSRLYDVAARLNGLREEDLEQLSNPSCP